MVAGTAVGPRLPGTGVTAGSGTPPLLHPIETRSHGEHQHPIHQHTFGPLGDQTAARGCRDKVCPLSVSPPCVPQVKLCPECHRFPWKVFPMAAELPRAAPGLSSLPVFSSLPCDSKAGRLSPRSLCPRSLACPCAIAGAALITPLQGGAVPESHTAAPSSCSQPVSSLQCSQLRTHGALGELGVDPPPSFFGEGPLPSAPCPPREMLAFHPQPLLWKTSENPSPPLP